MKDAKELMYVVSVSKVQSTCTKRPREKKFESWGTASTHRVSDAAAETHPHIYVSTDMMQM
jgi:hypothetical protein